MRKSLLFLVASTLILLGAFAQEPPSRTKLSPHLRMLVSGDPQLVAIAKQHVHIKTALKKRGLPAKAAVALPEPMVDVLVQFKGDSKSLEVSGAKVTSIVGNVASVDVPLGVLEALAGNPNVIRVEESRKRRPTLDSSVPSTGANKVWGLSTQRPLPPAWQGITGKNVVVGVVDSGIDLDHRDFRDISGKTRLLSVWDQTATGTPPSGFTSGDECSQAEINALQEKTDLVTSNAFNKTFSILLGNGSGGFGAATKSAEPNVPSAVAVADFNGDGNMDLVLGDVNNGTISIALGNGSGTFGTPTQVTVAAGFEMDAVAVGDFNHDGNVDLAVVLNSSTNVAVLLGKGDGTFGPPTFYTVGSFPSAIAVADLNGDGNLDLAVTNQGAMTISILLGVGDGTFGAATTYAVHEPPMSIAIGDLNGDGKPDLAVATYGPGGTNNDNNLSIFLGNGDGSFQAATTIETGHFESVVVLGDFNGDGKLDVALESYSHDVTVLLGNGDGTFGPLVDYELVNSSSLPFGVGQVTLAVGDFNGDGILDLASLTRKGSFSGGFYDTITVLLGKGDGTFGTATDFPTNSQNSTGIAVGNFHSQACAERDVDGHGTHVSGIAVGNGSATNSPDSNPAYRYIGMAPEADLIVVKTDFTDSGIMQGVQYIEQQAANLGKPAVVNLSLGGQIGAHDGTGMLEMALDSLTGPGKVVIVAAGNEARDQIHASGKVALGGTEQVGFAVQPAVSSVVLDIWYPGTDQLGVSLTSPASTCTIPANGFLYPGDTGQSVSALTACGDLAITASAINVGNGDHEILIDLEGQNSAILPGAWIVTLTGSGCGSLTAPCVSNGGFDIWTTGSFGSTECAGSPNFCVAFADHIDTSKTLGIPATATQVIAVGSHATKTSWTGVGGSGTDSTVTVGNISTFSSLGPRRNCSNTQSLDCTATVQKPELTAPGEEIMSSYAAGTNTGTCFDNTPASKCFDPDGQHHIEQGTSMAAPHVAGATALLLAKYGALNACETKEALQITRTDASTGATPNNTWGFGKLAIDLAIASRPASMSIVPNVVGLSNFNADTAIGAAGLNVGTVTLQTDPTVPEGDVISESPTAGTCAAQGSNVDLIVSAGPDTSVVPNVVGLSLAAAQAKITAASLAVGTVTHASSATVPAGNVISQNPVAGTVVLQQTSVNLVVSTGPTPVSVPNVVGLTQAAATTAITNAGLVLGTVTTASSNTVAAGSVISESPAAGTSVAPGSAVNLVVSSGPAPVAVPNVVGLTQAAATTAITNAGLVLGTVTTASSNTVAAGSVISESPAAGTSVAPGSAVNLAVSTGPAVTDVTSLVTVTRSGLVYNRTTNTFDSLLTITNSSTSVLTGPLILAISQIAPSSVTLSNPTGLTSSGNPYVSLTVPAGGLSPGQSISNVLLKFSDPNRAAFTFNSLVFALH